MSAPEDPPDDWREVVRDRIANCMQEKGFTQRGLGSAVGISGSAVAQWMGRGGFKQWWTLRKLVTSLGVSADWLLDVPDAEPPDGLPAEVVARAVRALERQADQSEKTRDQARALAQQLRSGRRKS